MKSNMCSHSTPNCFMHASLHHLSPPMSTVCLLKGLRYRTSYKTSLRSPLGSQCIRPFFIYTSKMPSVVANLPWLSIVEDQCAWQLIQFCLPCHCTRFSTRTTAHGATHCPTSVRVVSVYVHGSASPLIFPRRMRASLFVGSAITTLSTQSRRSRTLHSSLKVISRPVTVAWAAGR
jgi:hypothetical protein